MSSKEDLDKLQKAQLVVEQERFDYSAIEDGYAQ